MGFQTSPGVTINELDLTTVVPAVASTEGAIGGIFKWGPAEQRVLVDSESTLVNRFGKPTNYNAETFFTAANFLSYGNKLYVARGVDAATDAAVAHSGSAPTAGANDVKNYDALESKVFDSQVHFVARYLGALGNSLKISVCDSAGTFSSTVNLLKTGIDTDITNTFINFVPSSKTAIVTLEAAVQSALDQAKLDLLAEISVGDIITVNGQNLQIASIGSFAANTGTFLSTMTITFKQTYNGVAVTPLQSFTRKWEYFSTVNRAPQTSVYMSDRGLDVVDEIHVVVIDQDGEFTGTPGTVLEVFEAYSRATDSKTESGVNNYYMSGINQTSEYIYVANELASNDTGLATAISTLTTKIPFTSSFVLGADGADEASVDLSAIVSAYDMFIDATDVDVSLILAGKARSGTLANYIIANICEVRKDCMVFISPEASDVINVGTSAMQNVIDFRDSISQNSSYAVMDSGYKYQYDKYNDVYRYVPLNGDTAGTVVRTDNEKDAWWSPAGLNRGQIKNVVKLAYNPRKAERDVLYQSDINPVNTMPGQGTILNGDKTLLGKPSAFDRINVRRLFIVLEKAIATAANSFLFEFNDEFTRAQFKGMVEPFLRDVQGRRGITDFLVVVDSSNNTPEVIDRNEFVGSIFIKPTRSINYITLNFTATRTNVEFSEVVGSR